MNNLYEYIDPIASPYEAFLFDSTRDSLPIPAHWHYYVELLYVLKGEIEVSLDNVTSIGTEGSVILFPPKCVHSIALAKGSVPVQYDVIKFDPNLLPTCKTDELDLRSRHPHVPLPLYFFSGAGTENEPFSSFFGYS